MTSLEVWDLGAGEKGGDIVVVVSMAAMVLFIVASRLLALAVTTLNYAFVESQHARTIP